ncbi:MAG: hypothetical protein ACRDNS_00375, partial [Trebonia sp.]
MYATTTAMMASGMTASPSGVPVSAVAAAPPPRRTDDAAPARRPPHPVGVRWRALRRADNDAASSQLFRM